MHHWGHSSSCQLPDCARAALDDRITELILTTVNLLKSYLYFYHTYIYTPIILYTYIYIHTYLYVYVQRLYVCPPVL